MVKDLPAYAGNTGDASSVPGLGRSPGGGNGVCSSILTWKIPWPEEPGRLQSMGLQRVGHDWVTEHEHRDLILGNVLTKETIW